MPHVIRGVAILIALSLATGFSAADRFAGIDAVAEQEIAAGHVPGAVVEIGRGDAVLYRRAFGSRTAGPGAAAMTVDTLFDLASVTKVVATTTAILQLAERGSIRLDAAASTYWPAFAAHGKNTITIRDLLTHYSGLRPDLDMRGGWSGYRAAVQRLADERPLSARGVRYIYSDENFAVLGEIVRRVSGVPLDVYGDRHIFRPLQMTRTRFGSVPVNDPMAARMGGVAGHAGLFSGADDLARFARMWLRGGDLDGVRILQRSSVVAATTVQSPTSGTRWRGLGWDLAHPSASGRELPRGSFGHTGYTGTLIWIDPGSDTYVIILTNRTQAGARGDAQPLRDGILRLVFAPSPDVPGTLSSQ